MLKLLLVIFLYASALYASSLWAQSFKKSTAQAPAKVPSNTSLNSHELSPHFKNLGFSFGTLTEFVGLTQTNEDGSRDRFAFNPYVGFSTDIEMNQSWRFVPELNWVLPRTAGDSGITKNLFMFRADFGHHLLDELRLRYGTSLMVLNMRGRGGTQEVENGNGTSTFYLPSESQTAVNHTLDLGADFYLLPFSVRFQTFIYSAFNNERRQWSYALGVTYFYDLWKK